MTAPGLVAVILIVGGIIILWTQILKIGRRKRRNWDEMEFDLDIPMPKVKPPKDVEK